MNRKIKVVVVTSLFSYQLPRLPGCHGCRFPLLATGNRYTDPSPASATAGSRPTNFELSGLALLKGAIPE